MTQESEKTQRSTRVSQRDIADKLAISVATVSRSLRNDRSIHPSTRARVLSMAARLGYTLPDGRIPGDSRVRSLQVILGAPAYPVGGGGELSGYASLAGQQILSGISEAASSLGFQVAIHMVGPDDLDRMASAEGLPIGLREGQISGAILLQSLPSPVVEVLRQRVSCVSVVHHHDDPSIDCVDCDQAAAVTDLVTRLTAQGHRQLVFVGFGRGRGWERRRFAGFREGLFQSGIVYGPEMVLGLGEGLPARGELMRLLDERIAAGATALVCVADPIAFEVCRALQDGGRAIGGDLAVTGYDGSAVPAGLPSLTTVEVPYRDLGVAAVRRLIRRIEEPDAPVRSVLIQHGITEGQSTRRKRR